MLKLNFSYLKNYFLIFTLTYALLIVTKCLFILFLKNYFISYDFLNLLQTIFLGYKFDFAASAIVAFIGTLFDINKKIFAFVNASLLVGVLFLQVGDILYFEEASRHIAYEITDIFNDASSLFMGAFLQHSIIVSSIVILGILFWIGSFRFFSKIEITRFNKSYLLKKLFLVALSIFFIRGMLQHIPLNPYQSNQIGNTKLASLSLNATYNVLYALVNQQKRLQQVTLPRVSSEIIQQSFSSLYSDKSDKKQNFPIIKTQPNIVFLFLESWSAKFLQPYGFTHNTTPFFNKLLKKSIRPKIMIAGGHRTTEGLFTTLTSLQNPLGKTVANTHLQTFTYTSIIDILNQEGYSSAFFQGTAKETSGTGSFAQTLGFKYSYGRYDVKKRKYEENSWGIHDYDLYDFAESKIGYELKEPFVMGINGATTHDFMIPQSVKPIQFVADDNLNTKLNTFHFADFSLQHFIESMESKYPNTIFVLFADHCGGGIEDSLENYLIPFAIYSKKLVLPKYYDTIISQRDIAPTVYDLAIGNYKKKDIAFSGKSLISDSKFFADYYHNGTLGWIENNTLVEINTLNDTINCFEVKHFKKSKQQCKKESNTLRNNALSFTNFLQELLFSNQLEKVTLQRSKYDK